MRETDFLILGLLTENPLTGYQIKKIVDIRFHFFWSESYGQIYPTLTSLKECGLVCEVNGENAGSRAQKTYGITQAGRDALCAWLAEPVVRESVRLEILLKMYFSHLTDPDVMIGHLEVFRERHEKDLQILNMIQKELESLKNRDPDHPYVLQVVSLGQKINGAYVDWSCEAIKFLEREKNK